MISWPQALQSSSPGKTGISPAYLLDVEDVNGNVYYWGSRGSRNLVAPSVIVASGGQPNNVYSPWILSVPQITSSRTLETDLGAIQLQYLSGDSLQRDFEKIVRKSTLEGGLAVFRIFNPAAQAAEYEFHGTMSVDDSNPTAVSLMLKQLNNPSQDMAPQRQLSETCQWRWSSAQCGSTQPTPCQQSFPTCQVIERIFVVINSYEKNYGEAWSSIAPNSMNRQRKF